MPTSSMATSRLSTRAWMSGRPTLWGAFMPHQMNGAAGAFPRALQFKAMKKIDAFPHIFPPKFFERMLEVAPDKNAIKRWLHIPVLYDLDARLRMMDEFGPDYQQILTLSLPTLEALAPPDKSPELARLANDGMAEICAAHPNRFPGWVASIAMNNVPECVKEMERAIERMGARGVQVFTNVNGRPLDDPEFAPI